jgi:hypothetical protein
MDSPDLLATAAFQACKYRDRSLPASEERLMVDGLCKGAACICTYQVPGNTSFLGLGRRNSTVDMANDFLTIIFR